jgi:hypothetical protein
MISGGLCGQSVSDLDGLTPVGLAPGSPAGSYVLSNVQTTNLYDGGSNIAIPLLKIGGRGEAGYTMYAQFGPHWDADGSVEQCDPNNPNSGYCPTWTFQTTGWANWNYLYRPAGIAVRHLDIGSQAVFNNQAQIVCNVYAETLTRVNVGMADGTEMVLVDASTLGAPKSPPSNSYPTNNCDNQSGYNRGTVWVSTDGSAMTFIADANVLDFNLVGQLAAPGDAVTGTVDFRPR